MDKLLKTAKIWSKGEDSPLGKFIAAEHIVDNQHRDDMVILLETSLRQVDDWKNHLAACIEEENSLKKLLEFTKNSEICVDYGN